MSLQQITVYSFIALIILLFLAASFTSPLMIFVSACGTGVVVILQTYLILKDNSGSMPHEQQTELPNYQRK